MCNSPLALGLFSFALFFPFSVIRFVTVLRKMKREKFFKLRLGKMFVSEISKLGKTSDGRTNKEYRYSALFECGR